jgi:hypothetical protein
MPCDFSVAAGRGSPFQLKNSVWASDGKSLRPRLGWWIAGVRRRSRRMTFMLASELAASRPAICRLRSGSLISKTGKTTTLPSRAMRPDAAISDRSIRRLASCKPSFNSSCLRAGRYAGLARLGWVRRRRSWRSGHSESEPVGTKWCMKTAIGQFCTMARSAESSANGFSNFCCEPSYIGVASDTVRRGPL